jgi:hypothetical protein
MNEETNENHMLSVCFGRGGRCGYIGGTYEPFLLGGGALSHDDSEECPRCGERNWDGYGIEAYNARFMPSAKDTYTENDVGRLVRVVIEGVAFDSPVIEVTLPDGQVVYGPVVSIAHIFARYTMVESLMATSEHIRKSENKFSEDNA